MNDKQIDTLLEEVKNTIPAEISDTESAEVLLGNVKRRIRKRRNLCNACVAVIAVVLVCLVGIQLRRDTDSRHSTIAATNPFQPLLTAMALFPETGVALINDEVSTLSQQQVEAKDSCIRLRFLAPDGTTLATLDVAVADDDYIELDTDALTGSLMFCPCAGNETVIDIGLTLKQADQTPVTLRGIVAVADHAVCQLENNGLLVVDRLRQS